MHAKYKREDHCPHGPCLVGSIVTLSDRDSNACGKYEFWFIEYYD